MSTQHSANSIPEITREEHDGANNAKRVNVVAGGVGQATVTLLDSPAFIGIVTVANQAGAGNVTLNPSPNFIGIVTVTNKDRTITGNLTLSDSKGFIGLVTATGNVGIVGNVTLNTGPNQIGSVTVSHPVSVAGNLTLSDSKGFIGLTTTTLGASPAFIGIVTVTNRDRTITGNVTLSDAKTFIGLTTTTLGASPAFVGIVTVTNRDMTLTGNVTLSDAKTYIGLTTTTLGVSDRYIGLVTSTQNGLVTLAPSPNFIGIVTVTNKDRTITGNVTLSDAKTYIGLTTTTLGVGDRYVGLVTSSSLNAGTIKTLISLPVGLGNNSLATVAVPTNAQRIKVSNLVLGSNITTEIAIKSGVTYLTGNASLGVTLFPGGGFVMLGSPDSPSWIGLPSGAMVIEKRDGGGTVSKIGGGVIYFDEA